MHNRAGAHPEQLPHDLLAVGVVLLASLLFVDELNAGVTGHDVLLDELVLRLAVEMGVRELEADLLRDLLVHFRTQDSHRMLPEQTVESGEDLLHLLGAVADHLILHVAVHVHILRQVVCLLLEERALLELEGVLRPVISALLVVLRVQQVREGVVDILQLYFDFVVHGFEEVLKLGEAKFVEVESEGQLLLEVLWKLGEGHSVLGLSKNFNEGLTNM